MTNRYHLTLAQPGPAGGHRAVLLLAAILLAVLSHGASAAPEYALSGRAPQLAATVLAQTPLGPVSALDVIMLDEMTEHAAAGVPMDAWVQPKSALALNFQPLMRQAIEHLVTMDALARRAGAWRPKDDELRVAAFGAAEAAWIENEIKPQIKVDETDIDRYYLAHPEKYFNRLRAQVRYIFQPANMADPTSKTLVQMKMEALANQIKAGKITFEEAARRNSQAPSAAQGGLIPPFDNGSYFQAFEDQTFQLEKAGQISQVFEGPTGIYLLQLVQLWPKRNISLDQVRGEIREQLKLDHVRHYFNYVLSKVMEHRFVRNNSPFWEYLNLDAPIAAIDHKTLSREEYLRFFDDPIGADFQVNVNSVLAGSTNWVQGEVITQDLEARGQANHPWIQRARQLGEFPLKAEHVYAVEVSPNDYRTTQSAMALITGSKAFVAGLRSLHLVRFTIELRKPEKLSPSELLAARAQAQGLAAQLASGILPNPSAPVNLKDWLQKQVGGAEDIRPAVRVLATAAEDVKFTNVHLRVEDAAWQPVIPGSEYQAIAKDLKPGQMSGALPLGSNTVMYFVVAERPLDLELWKNKPLDLKTIAFALEASRIYHAELSRVQQSKSIQYTF